MESIAWLDPCLLVAAQRLAEQVERLDDSLDLGRERLELDVGDDREIVGAGSKACCHEPESRCENEKAWRS